MTSTPISANQVIDVPVDPKCLTVPCMTLPNVIQAIIDKLCLASPDFGALDFRCVEPGTNLLEVLQGIINQLPCPTEEPGPVVLTTGNVTNGVLTNLSGCTPDSWDCSDANACFTLTNPCNPGTLTVGSVIQALLDRNVSYGNAIKLLCGQVTALQSQISSLQLQVTQIQTSCCP